MESDRLTSQQTQEMPGAVDLRDRLATGALDALTLGEPVARSLGVDTRKLLWLLIAGIGLTVGASVAVAGIIGFVGLIVPHLVRPLTDRRPSQLIVPSALAGALLGGAVLTETVFNLAGVGRALFDAITGRDYAIVQGFTVVIAAVYVIVNLLVDLSYAYLDPRIRIE